MQIKKTPKSKDLFKTIQYSFPLVHRWQKQGPRAESGPPPYFIWSGTLFLPGGSIELLLNC